MSLDKQALMLQLAERLQQSDRLAHRAEAEAREAARSLATESEKREDGRAALEFGSLATGQANRARRVQEELKALSNFGQGPVPRFPRQGPVGLGALVDVSTEDEEGFAERTFFVLPVGAGTELTGPGGDGFLSVITPASPVGRALMGRKAGDTIEVTLAGEVREWTVLEVA
ncbi:GreA/GreB family elongation factor [Myxococcus sp. CA051A]|uniref:GreA/GreB family elongation factor n=1 Tax=Myxococcus llanfairpwllgwyngyllgogerychwyrndrobwllllantysiliogogogochensis TaxID=2590453 RepID=A0A540X5S0_9BACT|nr:MULTISPECIES: GreA/GreB family elongation factor [Myxococcus]MCP3166078.1 GreA/GreB family elongation factor [Myxococcus qinghaiensis]NTX05682.1 GreA/GreB family elongation factor [Myxococcus sp. CA040A]NTX10303.1 GreA/GreB family elongation factor [Myxococcus sp. CA056]NTX37492.1 GreA/GreB family elongation factor [Myxococcus sp. CA033]NTX55985.1 GreA/GreB family elongation factor [Myxococcus sp. CA039A]